MYMQWCRNHVSLEKNRNCEIIVLRLCIDALYQHKTMLIHTLVAFFLLARCGEGEAASTPNIKFTTIDAGAHATNVRSHIESQGSSMVVVCAQQIDDRMRVHSAGRQSCR